MRNIIDDIDKLITSLDITSSMYITAKGEYEKVTMKLANAGIYADFYPQGSFLLGTIVRPYTKGVEDYYDLDIIGRLNTVKSDANPQIVKSSFGSVLRKDSDLSRYLLPEDERCWTLKYNEYAFKLDIVPSAIETDEYINQLVNKSIPYEYAKCAIAITQKDNIDTYSWAKSNPQGYSLWFQKINEPYLAISRMKHRTKILYENKFFKSIEEIPPILDRSALQKAIQILKRHRDIFFSNASITNEKIWDYRPLSVIITTLSARIARTLTPTDNVLELLKMIAGELREHSQLQSEFDSYLFESRRLNTYIKKAAGKWSIKNPVNPDDDYTDCWTSEHALWFFKWLDAVYQDFFVELNIDERSQFAAMKKAFGIKHVECVLPESKMLIPKTITSTTKPYRST